MRTVVRTNGPIFIQVIGSSALTTIWNVRTLVRNILQQNRVMVTITKIHLYPVVLVLQTVFLFSSDFFRQILHFQWHTRSTATTFLLLEKGRAQRPQKRPMSVILPPLVDGYSLVEPLVHEIIFVYEAADWGTWHLKTAVLYFKTGSPWTLTER